MIKLSGPFAKANVLITQYGSACLADFGLTTMMPTETTSFSSPSFGGTTRWMSPELLDPDEHDWSPARTVHSDCYAFGMVIYEVRVL